MLETKNAELKILKIMLVWDGLYSYRKAEEPDKQSNLFKQGFFLLMANYWHHHRKHPALESIPSIHINRSGVADQFRRAVKDSLENSDLHSRGRRTAQRKRNRV